MRQRCFYHFSLYRFERYVLHIADALPSTRGDLLKPGSGEPRRQEPYYGSDDNVCHGLYVSNDFAHSQIGK